MSRDPAPWGKEVLAALLGGGGSSLYFGVHNSLFRSMTGGRARMMTRCQSSPLFSPCMQALAHPRASSATARCWTTARRPGGAAMGLNAEEQALVARARRGGGTLASSQPQDSAQASDTGTSVTASPYPEVASVRQLELLGSIDALLHAPPPPSESSLMRALSIITEHREREER